MDPAPEILREFPTLGNAVKLLMVWPRFPVILLATMPDKSRRAWIMKPSGIRRLIFRLYISAEGSTGELRAYR